jgi:hypothetical protein
LLSSAAWFRLAGGARHRPWCTASKSRRAISVRFNPFARKQVSGSDTPTGPVWRRASGITQRMGSLAAVALWLWLHCAREWR